MRHDNSRLINAMKRAGHLCACHGRADIVCNDDHCDLAGPGGPAGSPEAGQCRYCYLRLGGDPSVMPGEVLPADLYLTVVRLGGGAFQWFFAA